ncbi:uncharacterized protein [Solanum tuberosum]|uniref:uncharacterized protein n=1 Tax=Solanum tuberosum TaxID=4113 RepID=UPI0003D25580|nr:PREDICTED: uncharacterized protein LOC102585549 [Solanum tuberosum]
MSLSCLTCKISRTDSTNENKVKKGSHRTCNSGPIEFPTETPKLVRSPGIRRDWSFEDLQRQIVR